MPDWIWLVIASLVGLTALYDITQRRHAILRNFPLIGHLRYLLEAIGPELRQYIVTSNDEERPFSRDQRRWVYASSKLENNYFGFGTDNDLEGAPHTLIVKQATFPTPEPCRNDEDYDPDYRIPCAKVLGGPRKRPKAFRPGSVVNLSAMSFGSLSRNAVEAINRGCADAGALHNTGEGGISDHHDHGADLIWQLGTGYFGARDADGRFDLQRFKDNVAAHRVRAVEIKLSQGAKPGRGGVLPASKITPEIARIRGIPMDRDCLSPSGHSAFSCADSLLDFVESLADATGLPVGIKSAVGQTEFFADVAKLMARGDRGVDFLTIDGGEGGTGAAPLVFSDHVALPYKVGMARVYSLFEREGAAKDLVFIGSGLLGFPQQSLLAFALGADMINVAREAMLAIGCIQAQRCHSGHCPTGVATQTPWLVRGLDPTHKAARLRNYLVALRKEILWLTRATGATHPALVRLSDFEFTDDRFQVDSAAEVFRYEADWGIPAPADLDEIQRIMGPRATLGPKGQA